MSPRSCKLVDVKSQRLPNQHRGSPCLDSGEEDTVHVEQVLDYNQDPEYVKELLLYKLSLEAQKGVEDSGISKRELARQLGTSPSQLHRLLDPTNSSKPVGQMLALLHLVGREVDVVVKPRGLVGPTAL